MIMKKNAIIAKVRMPLTHQFFHLEDKLERALLRTSGVSSAEGGRVAASTRLSLSDAVSPSAFASDSVFSYYFINKFKNSSMVSLPPRATKTN